MSRDCFSSRFIASKSSQAETNENEFETLSNSIHFPPPRAPFSTITDPSQHQEEDQDSENDPKDKSEASQANRLSDKRLEASEPTLSKGVTNARHNYGTPRVSGRGISKSEPNSAQSTPARRVSGVGASAVCVGARPTQSIGGKGGSSSRVVSRPLMMTSESVNAIPHFELTEDSSFWKDHNVQVLIRIRPLSNTEMLLQGYGQCLREESAHTLVWLGHPETRFTFDHIACKSISQEKLFKVVGLPMVENCMSGYNSCMFAYGQTGSGKTYTMMGEISQMDGELSDDCGITPRIFEHLFSRIREEEENRRNEGLEYRCKCSFLEIYNEQITDLLEPSSTNLQLREDLKKGVHVENLTECNVRTVSDILKLLLQGSANRKMAATHMNSESSRSHSVFTCTIESYWEKDSMTHRRFGRLNLVDLAGSERQKSSGAEGDRLREAANINKSLSTLGLVIMSLVDVAHGKHRHVPYRDSRLTFLLQDSLGGNSKTTIIANVSPSMCSTNETLSTLKFAQRAKLIQNNAKVNEDASGDVPALQREIQQLKGQLSILMKHQDMSQSLLHYVPNFQHSRLNIPSESHDSLEGKSVSADHNDPVQTIKCLEATLGGALRREKLAETETRRLEAEIEQLNHLVQQREEDSQHSKMILRFREERIKCIELLSDGLISADEYIVDENNGLREENELLKAKIDRNPEVTRLALENIRLLQQLKLFQNYYEQRERETLLAEISELRDLLLTTFEGNCKNHQFPSSTKQQDADATKELKRYRENNSSLIRQVDDLQRELKKQVVRNQVAIDSHETISGINGSDEMVSDNQMESEVSENKSEQKMGDALVSTNTQKELMNARCLIEALDTEHMHLVEELKLVQEENHRLRETLSIKNADRSHCELNLENSCTIVKDLGQSLMAKSSKDTTTMVLQAKLDNMSEELEEAQLLNSQYIDYQTSQLSRECQINMVREEVEMETTKAILNLQHELAALQSEFQERLISLTEENAKMRDSIAAKEDEIKGLNIGWERATLELTNFLTDGSKSIREASSQIENISGLFSHTNVLICEHIDRAASACVEKEEMIINLQKSLEDAQNMIVQMDQNLSSLKGATTVFTELQQLENDTCNKELSDMITLLNDKIKIIEVLKNKLKYRENQIAEAEKCANAAFLVAKSISDSPKLLRDNFEGNLRQSVPSVTERHNISEVNICANDLAPEDIEIQVELARLGLLEMKYAVNSSYADANMFFASVEDDIQKAVFLFRELVNDIVKYMLEMRKNSQKFKMNDPKFESEMVENPLSRFCKYKRHENHHQILHQLGDKLIETNHKLNTVRAHIDTLINVNGGQITSDDLGDTQNVAFLISSSNLLANTVPSQKILYEASSCCGSDFSENVTKQSFEKKFEQNLYLYNENQESEVSASLIVNPSKNMILLLYLRKEFEMAYDAFVNLKIQMSTLLTGQEMRGCIPIKNLHSQSFAYEDNIKQLLLPETGQSIQPSDLKKEEAKLSCLGMEEYVDENFKPVSSFFTKFEEVHATMKEVDVMLNALVKENENEKQLTRIWKQAGEDFLQEKTEIIEEVKQLKSSICLKDQENEMFLDQINQSLKDMAKSLSLLKGSFLHLQRDVEELYKTLYADALIMAQDMLRCICNSRSSLEEIYSSTLVNEFTSLVLQCHIQELFYKFNSINEDFGSLQSIIQVSYSVLHSGEGSFMNDETRFTVVGGEREGDQTKRLETEAGDMCLTCNGLIVKNLELKRELERKDAVLKGLLFDFSLLQESSSTRMDIKDETEKLMANLSQVRDELQFKTSQLDETVVRQSKLEGRLTDTETALYTSHLELEKAKDTLDNLEEENAELRLLLEDLYLKKSETEKKFEEQREIVKCLEKEILSLTLPMEKQLFKDAVDDLKRVTDEKDQLREHVLSLQGRLDIAYALADENEARSIEAHHQSEINKVYAEQKEEEVMVLEHSVEELDCTINILEKKVYEMEEEAERHRLIRDSLEMEHNALRQKLLTVEKFKGNLVHENSDDVQETGTQISRLVDLCEAHNRIKDLEEERIEQAKEIKKLKEYISELVLHAEAQASQYQQKYKSLEAMVRGVKTDVSNATSAAVLLDKHDKNSVRPRGSSSPFRCISSLVQQMNLEKDQELTITRSRIEELETLVASRKKEVCILNARLAAAESMTHDVIRDLLGVKLDITNYANLIDHNQLQKLLEMAQDQKQESAAMEQEILNLKKNINDLLEERDRCISDVTKREADIMAIQFTVKQLQERDQLLTAQNEMLKVDKINLKKRVAELDSAVKMCLEDKQHSLTHQQINSLLRLNDVKLNKRLAISERLDDTELNKRLAH